MTRTPTSSFRLDSALLERVDQYAEQLARETGLQVSRTAAVSKLLTDALNSYTTALAKTSGLSESELRKRLTTTRDDQTPPFPDAGRPKRPTSRATRR